MRLRLPPEVRSAQILDAALAVFAERGYAAARMEDIAQHCGLSKSGLYAHFAGKEQVFAALLARVLVAPALDRPPYPLPLSAEQLVDWLLEQLYERLAQPPLRATLRLLVAEGERVPGLVSQWHAQVIQPYVEALGQLLAQSQPGGAGTGAPLLAREPWLALSPAVHGLLMQLVLPPGLAYPAERLRAAHREMLLSMLRG
jgi:AcrR family transcriptional regulator